MRVLWDPLAKEARNQVADYIRHKFGAKRKTLFLQEVRETTEMLKHSPNIGVIDPLFSDRAKTYRSVIINGLNKLVYFIEGDVIYIAAFWDTRQEPEKQAAQTE